MADHIFWGVWVPCCVFLWIGVAGITSIFVRLIYDQWRGS